MEMPYAVILILELARESHKKSLKRQELRRAVGQNQPRDKFGRKIAYWLGTQLVSWGAKLQGADASVTTNRVAINTK
jgi:hypothetical protein